MTVRSEHSLHFIFFVDCRDRSLRVLLEDLLRVQRIGINLPQLDAPTLKFLKEGRDAFDSRVPLIPEVVS
jgi:hypothetical protein